MSRAAALLAVGALALTACGSDNPTGGTAQAGGTDNAEATLSGTLSGSGASSQQAAMKAWKAGFAEQNPAVTVQYSPDGSGAGVAALLAGAVQFAGSDAYLDETQIEKSTQVCGPAGAFDVPVYISPIALAYNLPGVDELNLDPATIAGIFAGEITEWDDPAIAATNQGTDLPDLDITPVHRSDDSGTTENFTDYLHETAPKAWPSEASGNWPASLGGENAKGTSGVVSTVTSTKGSITYADASAVGGDLGTASIKVGDDFVPMSTDAAAAAVDAATPVEGRADHDIALDIDRTTDAKGAYPLVLVSYHVFCSQYEDAETAELVKSFGKYVVSSAGQEDSQAAAGSAPLSDKLSEKATKAIETIEVAS